MGPAELEPATNGLFLPGSIAATAILSEMKTTEIPLALIRVSPSNTRKDMEAGTEDTGLAELIESIRVHGLMSPVIVQEREEGYEVVAGQRRVRACRELGMTNIAAVVRNDLILRTPLSFPWWRTYIGPT